jgi:hypothetical protein
MKFKLAGALALAMFCAGPASAEDCRPPPVDMPITRFAYLLCIARQAEQEATSDAARAFGDLFRAEAERVAEDNRRAAIPHHDPGAIDLCPRPRKMTNDGCK